MKLAFVIFRYFPYGGLQRDMRYIAEEAIKHGHQVTIFCGDWQGDKIPHADIRVLDTFVWFNVAGVRRFVKAFEKLVDRNQFDLILGFNKMPGLDIYFTGDTCFAEKAYYRRNWLYRLTPRARLYLAYEKAVFGQKNNTCILSLVESQQQKYIQFYATPKNRFFSLPPGIVPEHIACANPEAARQSLLAKFGLEKNAKIIICIGSYFYRKGIDISIDVFSKIQHEFPNSALLIIGQDNAKPYQHQAINLGVGDKVFFVGACDQIGDWLHASDVFLHLAREELAGNVILEAMLSNCPVLVSAVCGYADYVIKHQLGKTVESLSDTSNIAQDLIEILRKDKLYWRTSAEQFYASGEAFSRIPVLMKYIEQKNNNAQGNLPQIQIEDWRNLQVDSCNKVFFDFVLNLQGEVVRKLLDRETLKVIDGEKTYYLKRHFGIGWKEIIKNFIQGKLPVTGAVNEWKALKLLATKNIPSLEPVTFGCMGNNAARKISFIITDELKDVVQVDHFLQAHSIKGHSIGIFQKIALIEKIARIASDMHNAGINHRDFYLCHFMLKKEWPPEQQPQVFIIDLHRAQIRNHVPYRWLVKDLAALYFSSMSLNVTQRDRLRFLCFYYLKPLREIYQHHRDFICEVEKKAKKLYLKHV